MTIDAIAYMEWAKTRCTGAVNLGRSGVPALTLAELGLNLRDFEINAENVYGWPPFLEAVAGRAGARPEQVIPAAGTSQAVFLALSGLVRPGDRVVVEKPAYEQFLAVSRALGAQIARLERRFEDGFRWDEDRLEEVLRTKPRLLVLTNLHNPSGKAASRGEIARLADRAAAAGAYVFVDEVYLEFLHGEAGRTAFGAAENILVGSSLTKAYGLSGLRAGWLLVPSGLVTVFRRWVDHQHVEPVVISQQIAARVIPRLDALRRESRPGIEANRRTVMEFIRTEPALEAVEPDGGIVVFPRLKGGLSGDDLALRLREGYDTSVVAGSFFESPRHFRLGFGGPADVLARGLDNIRRAIADLQGSAREAR